MSKRTIVSMPGDGIGKVVLPQAIRVLAAVGFVFVSFAGVTKIAAIAEEIKRPNRNLPLGILLSLAIVTIIYGAVTLILVGVVPTDVLSGDLRPVPLRADRRPESAGRIDQQRRPRGAGQCGDGAWVARQCDRGPPH